MARPRVAIASLAYLAPMVLLDWGCTGYIAASSPTPSTDASMVLLPDATATVGDAVGASVTGGIDGRATMVGTTGAGGGHGGGGAGGSVAAQGGGAGTAAGVGAAPGSGGRVSGTGGVTAGGATPGGGVGGGGLGGLAGATGVWRPAPSTSWQWQLTGTIDATVDAQMFDVDLFDTSAATVAALHALQRKVICYVSAGSYEDWRPDAAQFPAVVKGKGVAGWPGEQWLDVRQLTALASVMGARMDLCRAKGFDGIELDNVDGYTNDSGFPLTAADQLAYNRALAGWAHARGLSAGLKNDLDQVATLVSTFDWALNEECFAFDECDQLRPFVVAGKAVFNVEYTLAPEQFCTRAKAMGFNSLSKHLDLGAYRVACP